MLTLIIILVVLAPLVTLLLFGPGDTPLMTKPKRPGDLWPVPEAPTGLRCQHLTKEQQCSSPSPLETAISHRSL